MSTDGRVPGYQWIPNAHDNGGTYAGADYYDYKPRILLHMTVSMGISASYISGHSSPPHLWANPYNGDRFQTVELDRSAFALWQPDWGYHWLNKAAYCLQTELIGVPVVNQATYTDAHLRWIAANVVVPQERWLRARGLTANIGNYKYHSNSSSSASADWPGRMGEQEWADFNGLCAHIDAWANDHWDCSVERLDLISKYALEILGGQPSTEDDMTPAQEAKLDRLIVATATIDGLLRSTFNRGEWTGANVTDTVAVVRSAAARGEKTGAVVDAMPAAVTAAVAAAIKALPPGSAGGALSEADLARVRAAVAEALESIHIDVSATGAADTETSNP